LYKTVHIESMWGIHLIVIARMHLAGYIVEVEGVHEATGLAGVMGNKGGCAVVLNVFGTTRLGFFTCHLAARMKRLRKRAKNFSEIISGVTSQIQTSDGLDAIHSCDHVFWFGDLNYRINCGNYGTIEEFDFVVAKAKGTEEDLQWLTQHDQLLNERKAGRAFAHFHEGEIHFAPTYRMMKGEYAYSNKRNQNPSFCDRILWRTALPDDIELMEYRGVHELMHSDHRPVSALFRVRSKPPYLGPAPKTLEMSIHDTDITIAILDLTYEYEAPTGNDMEENDIDDAVGGGGDSAIADYTGMDHKFDSRVRTDTIAPMSTSNLSPAISKPREVIRKRGHRNSVIHPDLSLFADRFRVRGWLEKKKGKGLFKWGYQERWFELEAHYIVYKKAADKPILAAIDMRGVDSCVISDEKSYRFTLNLGGVVPRKYPLRAKNSDDLNLWVDAINQRLSEYRQQDHDRKFAGLGGAFNDSDRSEEVEKKYEDDITASVAVPASKQDDQSPVTKDSLQVRFVGTFLDSSKNQNVTHPVDPRENSLQVSGILPLLEKEIEGGSGTTIKTINTMDTTVDSGEDEDTDRVGASNPQHRHHDNGTSSVTTQQIFDDTFRVFVDGAETRKERNTSYTMYTVRCHALATDSSDPDMLIEEPLDVVVMRRYSDFRKMYDLVKIHLPLISASLPIFPSKQLKIFGGAPGAVIQKRVASFQAWLRALVKHPESWQLRELLEFLDDSSTIASRLTWTWNNWQSPVLSVNDSVDLEQLQMNNLFVVLGRGSSVQAQGMIPMRDYVTHAVMQEKGEEDEDAGLSLTSSATSSVEVGQPFSITLTRNGLHMGKLSGRLLVRRVAIREQVVKKLRAIQVVKKLRALKSQSSAPETQPTHHTHKFQKMSSLLTHPAMQPSQLLLEQLTSSLQVRIEGSEKIVSSHNDTKAKSFTKYRVSVSINGRRWIVSRRYSEFHNMNKVIASYVFLVLLFQWAFSDFVSVTYLFFDCTLKSDGDLIFFFFSLLFSTFPWPLVLYFSSK